MGGNNPDIKINDPEDIDIYGSSEVKRVEEIKLVEKTANNLVNLQDKVLEQQKTIDGTYATAKSDIDESSKVKITTETSVEAGEKITDACISVSAGADLRTMNLVKAKKQWEEKKATLKDIKSKFSDTKNKDEIERIIAELSDKNIESKVTDNSNGSKTNAEQHGNRYLIAARIAEGFIQTLSNLTSEPQPQLALTIDREKCVIGTSKQVADKQDDRYFKVDVALTVTSNVVSPTDIDLNKQGNKNTQPTDQPQKDLNTKPAEPQPNGGGTNNGQSLDDGEDIIISDERPSNVDNQSTGGQQDDASNDEPSADDAQKKIITSEEPIQQPQQSQQQTADMDDEDMGGDVPLTSNGNEQTKPASQATGDNLEVIGKSTDQTQQNVEKTTGLDLTTYNFREKLAQSLNPGEQIKNVDFLRTNPEISAIIDQMKSIGVDYDDGKDVYNKSVADQSQLVKQAAILTQVCAILRTINSNVARGKQTIAEAQAGGLQSSDAVIYIMIQAQNYESQSTLTKISSDLLIDDAGIKEIKEIAKKLYPTNEVEAIKFIDQAINATEGSGKRGKPRQQSIVDRMKGFLPDNPVKDVKSEQIEEDVILGGYDQPRTQQTTQPESKLSTGNPQNKQNNTIDEKTQKTEQEKLLLASATSTFQKQYDLAKMDNSFGFKHIGDNLYELSGTIDSVDVVFHFQLDTRSKKNPKTTHLELKSPDTHFLDISDKVGEKIALNVATKLSLETLKKDTNTLFEKTIKALDQYQEDWGVEVKERSWVTDQKILIEATRREYGKLEIISTTIKFFKKASAQDQKLCTDIQEEITEKTKQSLTQYLDDNFLGWKGLPGLTFKDPDTGPYRVEKGKLTAKDLENARYMHILDARALTKIDFTFLPNLEFIELPNDQAMIQKVIDLEKDGKLPKVKILKIEKKQFTQKKESTQDFWNTIEQWNTTNHPIQEEKTSQQEVIPSGQGQTNQPVKQETPAGNVENKTEKLAFTVDNLQAKLPKKKLYLLSYDKIFNEISAIKNQEVKNKISEYLLAGDVLSAQEYVGMKVGSRYQDNKADGILGSKTIDRFMLYGDEVSQNISVDADEVYKQFVSSNVNGGLPYAIVSKPACELYVFSADHRLISKHKVLLGKETGEKPNDAFVENTESQPKTKTTPAGMYSINTRNDFPNDYAGTGEYVSLYPEEGQYDVNNPKQYTLGIHTYYIKKGDRLAAFDQGPEGRRKSSGCINTLVEGAPFDNLVFGSKFYVTKDQ